MSQPSSYCLSNWFIPVDLELFKKAINYFDSRNVEKDGKIQFTLLDGPPGEPDIWDDEEPVPFYEEGMDWDFAEWLQNFVEGDNYIVLTSHFFRNMHHRDTVVQIITYHSVEHFDTDELAKAYMELLSADR